ncbi:MAG: MFS transporter, partial [Byssovorax sp.]
MNLAGNQATSTTASPTTERHGPALAAVTVLFFMWGFLTCLNDILVPHLKSVFDLGFARGALVQFSFFSAYFLVSLPAGKIVAKVGYKRGILIGLVVSGIGALLFYPAASLPSYAFFLSALFVLAAAIAFLQVAANPYVAVLGPKEGAPSRLNLTQA